MKCLSILSSSALIALLAIAWLPQAIHAETNLPGLTSSKALPLLQSVPAIPDGHGPSHGQRLPFQRAAFDPARTVLDSASCEEFIAPQGFLAFELDPMAGTARLMDPPYFFEAICDSALKVVPTWLRADLTLAFRRLQPGGYAELMADIIVASEPRLIDEVAFQVAHMSPQSINDPRFNSMPELIVRNAELIYIQAESLHYVRLVEHEGPDYYTTTEYRIADSSDTFWVTLPKDMYYWYIVHPKLSDEGVYATDRPSDRQQRTYGYFWREYLWYNPSPGWDYTTWIVDTLTMTCPRLGEVLQVPTVLWGRATAGFTPPAPCDWAVGTIGQWVAQVMPGEPYGDRGIQPNQIAHDHRGNCGEVQDLLGAAGRTALIPSLLVCNIAEDHVWNEFFDSSWQFLQVDRYGGPTAINPGWAGYDVDHGGSKEISSVWGYRGDGYIFGVTERYSSTCTLQVFVHDRSGVPIDGAYILVANESFYDTTSLTYCTLAWTDYTGYARIVVGEDQNYYIRVETLIGSWPAGTSVSRVVSASVPDERYEVNVQINALMPVIDPTPLTLPASGTYGLHLNWTVQDHVIGTDDALDAQSSEFCYANPDGGIVTAYLCDSLNLARLRTARDFSAYPLSDAVMGDDLEVFLPTAGKWYAVFVNRHCIKDYELVRATCALIDVAGVADGRGISALTGLAVHPSPFTGSCRIVGPANSSVEVLDMRGRLVTRLHTDRDGSATWQPGSSVEVGTYLVRLAGQEGRRVVFLRGE